MIKLTEKQQYILNNSPNKSVVIAAAASGKTTLLTEKVRQVIKSGVDPHSIAVITFTRIAAAELIQRLGSDYKDGIYVGTIHGLAYRFLLQVGIDMKPIIDTAKEKDKFDILFKKVEEVPECVQYYDWVFLDEAQDSNEDQFHFILDMIKPDHYFFVGDPKQSIYMFNSARPDLFEDLMYELGIDSFDLNENFRNGFNILTFAKTQISASGQNDTSIAKRPVNGLVVEGDYYPDSMARIIKATDQFKDWAVLAFTNAELDKQKIILEARGIPTSTFKQGDLSLEDLTRLMEENTVKLLTIHSAKGLEWNNVIILDRNTSKHIEHANLNYVAVTRARDKVYWLKTKSNSKKSWYKKKDKMKVEFWG